MEHKDHDVVMVARDKPRVQIAVWLCFSAAIIIVAFGWVFIVGKRLAGAMTEARGGIETAVEAAGQFRTETDTSRGEVFNAADLIFDQLEPVTSGIQQRQDALELLSGALVEDLTNTEETIIEPYVEEEITSE